MPAVARTGDLEFRRARFGAEPRQRDRQRRNRTRRQWGPGDEREQSCNSRAVRELTLFGHAAWRCLPMTVPNRNCKNSGHNCLTRAPAAGTGARRRLASGACTNTICNGNTDAKDSQILRTVSRMRPASLSSGKRMVSMPMGPRFGFQFRSTSPPSHPPCNHPATERSSADSMRHSEIVVPIRSAAAAGSTFPFGSLLSISVRGSFAVFGQTWPCSGSPPPPGGSTRATSSSDGNRRYGRKTSRSTPAPATWGAIWTEIGFLVRLHGLHALLEDGEKRRCIGDQESRGAREGVESGTGQNDTPSVLARHSLPPVFGGPVDVSTRVVRCPEQVPWYLAACPFAFPDRASELAGIPVDDDHREKIESSDPEVLGFGCPVTNFAPASDPQGALQGMVRLAPVQAEIGTPLHSDIQQPLDDERCPSTLPVSRGAMARSCWRGYAANFRRSWPGGIVPDTIVATPPKTSGQLAAVVFSRILSPISPLSSVGTPFGSKT